MGTYVVTGSASGMGRQAADKLRGAGHTVIGVDIGAADVTADLSTPAGRRDAAARVLDAAGGILHGAVLAAGLGPTPGAERLVLEVNYYGVVELLEIWRPSLAAGAAKVVIIGSNSTTTTPLVPGRAVRALLGGKPDTALTAVKRYTSKASPAMAYAASKIAVSRWARRTAVTADWAGAGIRVNVLAPGAILTPLLEKQLATPSEAKAIRAFPVPVGHFGDAGRLADWMMFMLSDAAEFLCGSVIFVDGGSDAYLRADAWPTAVPARRLPGYLLRFWRGRSLGGQ